MRYIVLVVAFLVAITTADVMNDGKCPELEVVHNFNTSAYLGTWYEISKYPNDVEKKGNCASAEYTLNGDSINVKNTHIIDGTKTIVEGIAKMAPDANNTAKILVTFKFGDVVKESPLWILGTNYTNYSVAYSCRFDEKLNKHRVFTWVMSRNKTLEGEAKTNVETLLKSNNLDSTKLLQTDFSEDACKYKTSNVITEPVGTTKV